MAELKPPPALRWHGIETAAHNSLQDEVDRLLAVVFDLLEEIQRLRELVAGNKAKEG